MPSEAVDSHVRAAAFAFLEAQSLLHGNELPYRVLSAGFQFQGTRVPLLGPQGIFKPAVLSDMPLSIATAPEVEGKARPYDDQTDPQGHILYRYRGTDPAHRDNRGLRLAMQRQTPLVYLYGVAKGWYLAQWPVYVVGDDPQALTFKVAVDDQRQLAPGVSDLVNPEVEGRRRYVTALALRRVHQASFRERVLQAYRTRCSVCHLRHRELLDAAHIIPDSDPRGEPSVQNGLALCKLHHAAFDGHFFGIRPDYIIEVRPEILREEDGPMLLHGLKDINGTILETPKRELLRPRQDFLEERYQQFRKAG
jgi:putative restriction endonuclease